MEQVYFIIKKMEHKSKVNGIKERELDGYKDLNINLNKVKALNRTEIFQLKF